jgi:hypothetical protein
MTCAISLGLLGLIELAGIGLLLAQKPRPAFGPPLPGHRRKTDRRDGDTRRAPAAAV